MSPTNKLHAAYEPISEAELLADGLIEPVSPPTSSLPLANQIGSCLVTSLTARPHQAEYVLRLLKWGWDCFLRHALTATPVRLSCHTNACTVYGPSKQSEHPSRRVSILGTPSSPLVHPSDGLTQCQALPIRTARRLSYPGSAFHHLPHSILWGAHGHWACALQVSLEMDDESEDEVEALAEMYDPDCSSDGTYRFVLLKELWASAR